MGIFSAPRAVPERRWAIVSGAVVVALALPIAVAASAPVSGWVLAAVLWIAGEVMAVLLARLPLGADSLATSGMRAVAMTFRVIAIMAVLLAVTVANEPVGVTATIIFVAAYTMELLASLSIYFGGAK